VFRERAATSNHFPSKSITCGLLVASSLIVKWPGRLPAAFRLKVTLIEQVLCAARLAAQVLVSEKSPVAAIPIIFTVASPSLVTCKVLGGLVRPTFCIRNFKSTGEMDNAPGVAVGVAVGVLVAVAVRVAVEVGVRVGDTVALGKGVRTEDAVGDEVGVGVVAGVGVAAGVGVGIGAELLMRNTCAW